MSRASSPARRLKEAVYKKDATEVQEAVAEGADPDICDDFGWPLLVRAANNGWTSSVEQLLALGANANQALRNGFTALHAAAIGDKTAMVELLIEAGGNVDATTWDEWTPLHRAANWDAAAAVEVLLRHNANQHATNNDGETPLQLAKRCGSSKAIEAFENFTASQATVSSATAVQRESTTGTADETQDLRASYLLPFDSHRPSDFAGRPSFVSDISTSDSEVGSSSVVMPFLDPAIHVRDDYSVLGSTSTVSVVKEVEGLPSATAHSVPFIHTGITWKLWSSSSATIGSEGSRLSSDRCDIQLIVPPFAVSSPQPFSMCIHALAGESHVQPATTVDVIELKPHNINFDREVELIAGHANVFSPDSSYSLALYYSADGKEWQEPAVLTHIDQREEYEGMAIRVEENHVCVKTRHFSWIICKLFHRSMNVSMKLFVPKKENENFWLLKVYLIKSDRVAQEFEAIKQTEEQQWDFFYAAESSVPCEKGQQLVMKVQPPLPTGWEVHKNYETTTITFDGLERRLWHCPYYIPIRIPLSQNKPENAINMTDIKLHLEVQAEPGNETQDQKCSLVVEAWRPRQGSSSSDKFQNGATSMTSHDGEASAGLNVFGVQPRFSLYITSLADKIRKSAPDLDCFWFGWSKIPVGVLHEVCHLAAQRPEILADYLDVSMEQIEEKEKADNAVKLVRQVMEIWVHTNAKHATLEVLFTALEKMKLLRALVARLKPQYGDLDDQT